ncbi:MAG: DAK2 domain-containing protein [Bacteroidales bacterium]|nr:DAK2 domain-containing protein [Bacteroidales bacterium]
MQINELDSPTFAAMLRQGAVQLGSDKKAVNDLNVFPIPDGDTGDNMLMTLRAGCTALKDSWGRCRNWLQRPHRGCCSAREATPA